MRCEQVAHTDVLVHPSHCAIELKFTIKLIMVVKLTRDWLIKSYNFIKNFAIEFKTPNECGGREHIEHTLTPTHRRCSGFDFGIVYHDKEKLSAFNYIFPHGISKEMCKHAHEYTNIIRCVRYMHKCPYIYAQRNPSW